MKDGFNFTERETLDFTRGHKPEDFTAAKAAISLYTHSGTHPIFLFLWQNAVYLLGAFILEMYLLGGLLHEKRIFCLPKDAFFNSSRRKEAWYVITTQACMVSAALRLHIIAVIVPAGTWHNLINTGNTPLKLYSIYAPPHHPFGTVQRRKEGANH